jgi:hypothetical protein
MSEGVNSILIMLAYIRIIFPQIWIIITFLISYLAAKLNYWPRLKILPPLSHHYAIWLCYTFFCIHVYTPGKILHWIWWGLDRYQTIQIIVYLFYPNVKCSVTRLRYSYINLL